jgi:hypothetical protein
MALPLVALSLALPLAASEIWRELPSGNVTESRGHRPNVVSEDNRIMVTPRKRTDIMRNPFRADGRMIPPKEPSQAPTLAEPAPRAVYELHLKGLVGGPPWTAIIAGLPGVSGDRSVRLGERFRELLILEITADGVRIGGGDSTWTLSLKQERTQ